MLPYAHCSTWTVEEVIESSHVDEIIEKLKQQGINIEKPDNATKLICKKTISSMFTGFRTNNYRVLDREYFWR